MQYMQSLEISADARMSHGEALHLQEAWDALRTGTPLLRNAMQCRSILTASPDVVGSLRIALCKHLDLLSAVLTRPLLAENIGLSRTCLSLSILAVFGQVLPSKGRQSAD